MPVIDVKHPLVKHKVGLLREEGISTKKFRELTNELARLLCYEATADFPLETATIDCWSGPTEVLRIAGRKVTIVPILRAGLGMLEAVTDMFPRIAVGYLGLERDHTTAIAHTYYSKLPPVKDHTVLIVDPMLASGGSAEMAIDLLLQAGATDIRLLAMLASPEGVKRLQKRFPTLPVVTAALDRELNAQKYILPGLGDFGDRLYGTGAAAAVEP